MTLDIFSNVFIQQLFIKHNFRLPKTPFIIVYRNTNHSGEFVPDTGDNNCDTVLLVDKGVEYILSGRSYPHQKYQKQQVEGISACNYIAPGFYKDAWVKGYHRGYRALVQKRSFMIYRSKDMELGNEDDYNEYGIVADNFHGCAPYSAGCVTVEGAMSTPGGDWVFVDAWIYRNHPNVNAFSVAIFQHDDLFEGYLNLKFGSSGAEVEHLQQHLRNNDYTQIKVDGEFGPTTYFCLQDYKNKRGY